MDNNSTYIGQVVLYPTGTRTFGAVVDSEPRFLGDTEVVDLIALGPEYRDYTGTSKCQVKGAAVQLLQPAPKTYADGKWIHSTVEIGQGNVFFQDSGLEPTWAWISDYGLGTARSYESARVAVEDSFLLTPDRLLIDASELIHTMWNEHDRLFGDRASSHFRSEIAGRILQITGKSP